MYTKTYKCVNVVSKLDKTYILLAYLFIVLIDCSAAYANLIGNYQLPITVLYFSLGFLFIIRRTLAIFFHFYV